MYSGGIVNTMKILSFLLFVLLITHCSSLRRSDKTMETLYIKNLGEVRVEMHFKQNDQKLCFWEIYLQKNKNEILLDKYEMKDEPVSFGFRKYGDVRRQVTIGDAVWKNNSIYIALYQFGKIFLKEYTFRENREFIKKEYYSGRDVRGTYENFGDPFFSAEIKIFDKDLYFTARYCGLLHFDTSDEKITEIIFFNSTSKPKIITPNDKKIGSEKEMFNYQEKIFKTVRIAPDKKKLLAKYNDNPNSFDDSEKTKELIRDLKKWDAKPYHFYEIKNISQDEQALRNNSTIVPFPVYRKEDLTDTKGIKKIENYLKEAVAEYEKKPINNLHLLGYLQEVGNEDITCFFYKENYGGNIEIARYDNDDFQWFLGNYREVEIKEP